MSGFTKAALLVLYFLLVMSAFRQGFLGKKGLAEVASFFELGAMLLARTILSAVFAVVLTGCALTRTETKVNFAPAVQKPIAAASSTATLAVGKIEDSRPVNDPRVLVHKKNGYGQTTSGAFIAQEPVAGILQAGIESALRQNQFPVGTADARYEVRGKLQEFDFDVIVGFWSGTVKPKISVRLEVIDLRTGRSVWHDTFVGRDTIQAAWGNAELIATMFTKAADSVIEQFVSDASFRDLFAATPQP